jgi:hypothetical protein
MSKVFTTQELKDLALKLNASFVQDSVGQIRLIHNMGTYLHTQKFWGNSKNGFTCAN